MPVFDQPTVAATFTGLGVPSDRIDLTSSTYAGVDRDQFFKVILPAFHAYLAEIKAPNGKTLAQYDIMGATQDNVCHDFELYFRAWGKRDWWVQMNAITPPALMADSPAWGTIKGPAPFDLATEHSWGWFLDLDGKLHLFEAIPNVVTVEYPVAAYDFTEITGVAA